MARAVMIPMATEPTIIVRTATASRGTIHAAMINMTPEVIIIIRTAMIHTATEVMITACRTVVCAIKGHIDPM